MIIEDDESIAAIERDYLSVAGFGVDIAATGERERAQISLGAITLHTDTRRVFVGSREVEPKNKECELLCFLMSNADIVFSRETLYERIWGYDAPVASPDITGRTLLFLVLSGLATGASWLCYFRALQDGPASVVMPIDKLSILVTIVFSGLVLHEKLSRKAAAGLALILIGTGAMLL